MRWTASHSREEPGRVVSRCRRETLVVGGWLEGPGGHLEAVLVGRPYADGRLLYMGVVRDIEPRLRRSLAERLRGVASEYQPFALRPLVREARWARPEVTLDVVHHGLPDLGIREPASVLGEAQGTAAPAAASSSRSTRRTS